MDLMFPQTRLDEFKAYLKDILERAGYYDPESGLNHVYFDVVEILLNWKNWRKTCRKIRPVGSMMHESTPSVTANTSLLTAAKATVLIW
jgi:hypothetical protein